MVGRGYATTPDLLRHLAQNYFFGYLKNGRYFRAEISLIQ
jgi:hypothetical protein